jgi:hypothetical protein
MSFKIEEGILLKTRRSLQGIDQTQYENRKVNITEQWKFFSVPKGEIVLLVKYAFFFDKEEVSILHDNKILYLTNTDFGHDFEIMKLNNA